MSEPSAKRRRGVFRSFGSALGICEDDLESVVSDLTTQLEQSQTCIANLREALDSEQEQRRAAHNSLIAVRKDTNAKDRRIEALLAINSALTKEKDTLDILLVKAGQQQDVQVAEMKAQLNAAEAEHEKERDEHAKSIQDLKSKLTLRNEILTTQLEQAKKDQEGQASRDAELISQRESYIADITAKLNAKEEEHQRTMDSLYKEKADQSELVAELQRDVERVETLESEIKRLRTVNETLQGVIHQNSKDYAEALKSQLGCTRDEFERIRECLRKQKEVQQAQLNMKQAQSQLMMAMTDVQYSAQKLIKDGHREASI